MPGQITRLALKFLDNLSQRLPVGKAKPLPAHLVLGRRGEDEAYFYLRSRGYVIVSRNYRSPRHRGELDLVGWDGDFLCFIEVKTRSSHDVKPAEAAVDGKKQRDLAAVARDYWRRVPGSPPVRFDVVTIYYEQKGACPDITLFQNAFPMP